MSDGNLISLCKSFSLIGLVQIFPGKFKSSVFILFDFSFD